jgi:hypothetical protein
LWLPLAISFTLMMLEAPVIQAALARLPESTLHLAAFGLALALSLVIESPVIMLLATAIALVKDAGSYRALRFFTLWLSGSLTILTALVAFTPLFDWLGRKVLGAPLPIVEAAKPAMQIMLFWTAAIAWRRFYQGVLVRYGYTRLVSWGTAIRLIAAFSTAFGLVAWGKLPGSQVAAWALMAAVVVEAIATTLFALPMLKRHGLSSTIAIPIEIVLSQREILKFHTPLAGTTLLAFLIMPLTNAALARLPHSELTLAAWPVVFGTLLVLRGWGFALQEITVAVMKQSDAPNELKRFTWAIALSTSAALALLSFTPLTHFYLQKVIQLRSELFPYVESGLRWCLLIPALTAFGFWARGILVAVGATSSVYWGMGVNLIVNSMLLGIGVMLHLPSMALSAGAFTCAATTEYFFLMHQSRMKAISKEQEHGSEVKKAEQEAPAPL